LKSFVSNVQLGDKSATEVADSVNAWLKEGGEALKVKIEDEVERSVSKMGFVKRGEFEALKQEVAALQKLSTKKATKKEASEKKSVKKDIKKKSKKDSTKKAAK
jgi:BMFP domain-containing protein YqiC